MADDEGTDDSDTGTEGDDEGPEGTDESGTDTGTETGGSEEDDEDAEALVIASLTPAQAAVFQRQQDALSKANASARSKRMALKALRAGKTTAPTTGPKPTAPKTGTGPKTTDFDPEAFKASILAELKGQQNADKLTRAAERGLRAAGLVLPEDSDAAEAKLARVMRMLDLDGVELDEVGDEIADLKSTSPELFTRKRKPKTGGVGGPTKTNSGSKAPDAIAAMFD